MIGIETFDCTKHKGGGWTCVGKLPISKHNVQHLEDIVKVKGIYRTVTFKRIARNDTDYVFYYNDEEVVMLKWLID